MTKTYAWAVMEGDELVVDDCRVPVFWLLKQAQQFNREQCIDGRVVRVEVREVPRQRRR